MDNTLPKVPRLRSLHRIEPVDLWEVLRHGPIIAFCPLRQAIVTSEGAFWSLWLKHKEKWVKTDFISLKEENLLGANMGALLALVLEAESYLDDFRNGAS